MAAARTLVPAVLGWYDHAARDLPWRHPDVSPWAVLVSEVMLGQTPVVRVLPAWRAWLERWPTAAALADDSPGAAVRMWNRLGYPRRALRLHQCAVALRDDHGGEVPADVDTLLTLPGVGAYTARAVAAFAFGQRVPVVDTNVRRVIARAVEGRGEAGPPRTTRDLAVVESLLPRQPPVAARLSVAFMELGALVCTARAPKCADCPIERDCAWVRAGRPVYDGPRLRVQKFDGTDRQVRGLLMAVLRESDSAVPKARLDVVWSDHVQRERALDSLVADGLVDPVGKAEYQLPR